jgi:hypothetical protein
MSAGVSGRERLRWVSVRDRLLCAFVGVALVALCTPSGTTLAPWFAPIPVGLPFFFGWNVFWVAASMGALWAYDRSRPTGGGGPDDGPGDPR